VSYILDALKKVERDRRRVYVPSLATMHAAPPERRVVWPWIAGGLAAATVVAGVAIVVFRSIATPVPAAPTPPVVAAPKPTAPPGAATTPESVSTAPVSPSPSTAPAGPESASAPTAAAPAPPADTVRTSPPPKSATTTRTPSTAAEPGAAPARATPARLEREDLKLEVLVFSDHQAERSAWISGHRYVEGQRVQGRFLVEQILRDSVVLTAEGRRIVLKQE